MPARLRLSGRARDDLLEIWEGVAAHDPAAADRLYDRLAARLRILDDFVEAGVARPDIAPEARMLVERPYVILYRVPPDGIQIVRVLHGARHSRDTLFIEGTE